ncbi:U3 small nucleolar RNA-associated protein 15 homolog [Mya arenaria]|uniref:U3 small nucleolar RNA-associated protein 15 homolog n=1 Tax=Mya arenaria TaxID=6604 RepID=UPI0022DF1356|nr:U3 small nucleolar RNA-associated protein 15 homolog [Mya arenaria]
MAASFKKINVKTYQKTGEKVTTDTLYWKNLEVPVVKKEYGAISHIDFSPISPYQLAVTNSTRVQIYNSTSLQIHKTLSRFKQVAYCGSFRSDGKLLVAGGDEGSVRLFDVASKNILRIFKGHAGSVHVSRFLSSNTHVLTGSDDNTVRIWDIPSEQELVSYSENQDYVRCGVASQSSKDIVLTGSYDHTVRLFDTRLDKCVMCVDHGAPVESVLMFPTGGLFVSAGGSCVRVWDALAGGKLVTTLSHHHKTITCLAFASNHQRLLSGALDRHIKIYDVSSYQVVHTLDCPGAVLSVGVSPDDSLLAVGTVEGLVSLQRRKPDTAATQTQSKKKPISFRYGLRGKTIVPSKDDYVVEHRKKEKLAQYDRFFKKFEHSKALDSALESKLRATMPQVTVGVMQELARRGALRSAIAGREGGQLKSLLSFIRKNISNPQLMPTLIDVTNIILDIYGSQMGRSSVLDTALHQLKVTVDQEVTYMTQMLEVIGQLDTLFSASQATQPANKNEGNGSCDLGELLTMKPSESATAAF